MFYEIFELFMGVLVRGLHFSKQLAEIIHHFKSPLFRVPIIQNYLQNI